MTEKTLARLLDLLGDTPVPANYVLDDESLAEEHYAPAFPPFGAGVRPTSAAGMPPEESTIEVTPGIRCHIILSWTSSTLTFTWFTLGSIRPGTLWAGFLPMNLATGHCARYTPFLWLELGSHSGDEQTLVLASTDLGFDPTQKPWAVRLEHAPP